MNTIEELSEEATETSTIEAVMSDPSHPKIFSKILDVVEISSSDEEINPNQDHYSQHQKKNKASSTFNPSQIIVIYPPPPLKGGIAVNLNDYNCLRRGHFLNDIIIDLYLKYYWMEVLPDVDRERTHIFSSFFYQRLSTAIKRQSNENLSPAEKRHAQVQKWTKSIDIFTKDFIMIPVNKKSHWFLVVICFPGLTGPVRASDGTPIPNIRVNKPNCRVKCAEKHSQGPRAANTKSNGCQEEHELERGYDDEEILKDDDQHMEEACTNSSTAKPNYEPIKQPCILIFDSLAHASRSRICTTLREYLQVEWEVRNKGKPRDFSKEVFKGASPKVPQQDNLTDCGLYVLQFVESFFETPITDFKTPIQSIENWFDINVAKRKRYAIMELINFLVVNENRNVKDLNIPDLNLTPYDSDDDK